VNIKYSIEKKIRETVNAFGFDLHRLNSTNTPIYHLVKSLNNFEIDIVFDVGANVGQFAKGIRQAGYKGNIVSFEPLSQAYTELLSNAKNDSNWIINSRCALGDRAGESVINISGNSVSSSILEMMASHVDAANKSIYIDQETVPVQTLDSLVNNYVSNDKKFFLKLDTQGYEWQVLNGASHTLSLVDGILLEVSLVELYKGQRLWKEIIERLERCGFTIWSIDRMFSDPKNGRTLQCDIVFFHQRVLQD
jgi:FkbM family methyltransferase